MGEDFKLSASEELSVQGLGDREHHETSQCNEATDSHTECLSNTSIPGNGRGVSSLHQALQNVPLPDKDILYRMPNDRTQQPSCDGVAIQ